MIKVTFDEPLKDMIFELISPEVKDKTCPFCGTEIINTNQFGGAFHYEGEPRFIHTYFPCLMAYSQLPEPTSSEQPS